MVLLAIGQQRQAVGEAGVALELTVRAGLGAFQEVLGLTSSWLAYQLNCFAAALDGKAPHLAVRASQADGERLSRGSGWFHHNRDSYGRRCDPSGDRRAWLKRGDRVTPGASSGPGQRLGRQQYEGHPSQDRPLHKRNSSP